MPNDDVASPPHLMEGPCDLYQLRPFFLFFADKVERENNKDYNQVLLDVQRSLRRFPPGELIPQIKYGP